MAEFSLTARYPPGPERLFYTTRTESVVCITAGMTEGQPTKHEGVQAAIDTAITGV
jgi:hypothetical protein